MQDGAHGHQRQRQVQLPPEVLQQGGVAPLLQEPETASFASGAGDAVLLTSTGDDDLIDAQTSAQLPSTGDTSPAELSQWRKYVLADNVATRCFGALKAMCMALLFDRALLLMLLRAVAYAL